MVEAGDMGEAGDTEEEDMAVEVGDTEEEDTVAEDGDTAGVVEAGDMVGAGEERVAAETRHTLCIRTCNVSYVVT